MIRTALLIFFICGSFSLGFLVSHLNENKNPIFTMHEVLTIGLPVIAKGSEGSFYIVGDGSRALVFAIEPDGRYALVGNTNSLMLSKPFMLLIARLVGISV